jgi:hypothetical protein
MPPPNYEIIAAKGPTLSSERTGQKHAAEIGYLGAEILVSSINNFTNGFSFYIATGLLAN